MGKQSLQALLEEYILELPVNFYEIYHLRFSTSPYKNIIHINTYVVHILVYIIRTLIHWDRQSFTMSHHLNPSLISYFQFKNKIIFKSAVSEKRGPDGGRIINHKCHVSWAPPDGRVSKLSPASPRKIYKTVSGYCVKYFFWTTKIKYTDSLAHIFIFLRFYLNQ